MPSYHIIKKGAPRSQPQKAAQPLFKSGQMVFFGDRENKIAGAVLSVSDGFADVALAVPNYDGVLVVSKSVSRVALHELVSVDAVAKTGGDVKEWESRREIDGVKSASLVEDSNGRVVDYSGVTFKGYGSTFGTPADTDRDGEYVVAGAFDSTLDEFKQNPVMLVDHARSVKTLAGHYEDIKVDRTGLSLKGVVSDSPWPLAQHVRFSVQEGSLKTLSMGGYWFIGNDGRAIELVKLYEVSLVVVPANPKAQFQVRGLSEESVAKAFQRHALSFGGEFRQKIS